MISCTKNTNSYGPPKIYRCKQVSSLLETKLCVTQNSLAAKGNRSNFNKKQLTSMYKIQAWKLFFINNIAIKET